MVFQSYTLFPWLTIADNIAFGLREKGVPAQRRNEVVRDWLGRVGLTGFERSLSQAALGRDAGSALAHAALANDPAILLLDEPFGALDSQTRARRCRSCCSRSGSSERKTVLFVTHDIDEAIFLGTGCW